MTATPIAPVEEKEDDDILEWIAPEGELPTEFTWDDEEEGDTTTTVDTDTTTTTDTTATVEQDAPSDLDQLIEDTGEFPALQAAWEIGSDIVMDAGATAGRRLLQGLNNRIKDVLFQPNQLLGAVPLDPDDYPRDKYPNLYTTRNKTVINEQGEEVLVPLMKPDGSYMFDSNNQLMYEQEFIGPLMPQMGLGGKNYDTVSLFGENPLFGIQLGEARGPQAKDESLRTAESGEWADYGFLLSETPLPKREDVNPISGFIGELGAFALMFRISQRGLGKKGAKLDFPFTKKAEALISKGGFSNILKGRTIRAISEGTVSGYISQNLLGQPGEGDVPMMLSNALVNIGDELNTDLRGPLTNYFGSENSANDPYHKARLRADIGDFIQAPFFALSQVFPT